MEPRLFSHGDNRKWDDVFTPQKVSMEPRLFSHGDSGHFSAFTDIEKKTILAHNVNI
jgi:hypothetical protein